MSRLAPNFSRNEMACRHCGKLLFDPALLMVLQATRAHFKRPVTITSGYRCIKHNAAVGGASDSRHVLGQAADIRVQGIAPALVYLWLDNAFGFLVGLGSHRSFTHVDVCRRVLGRRWTY